MVIFFPQRELEKQRQMEHSRLQITMATQHYATTLRTKFGLLPWKRLIEMTQENMSRATLHHSRALLSSCLYPWLEYTRQVKKQREKAAELLYNKILLRRTWRQWRKVRLFCYSQCCINPFSKIQLVVYYQCCILIG